MMVGIDVVRRDYAGCDGVDIDVGGGKCFEDIRTYIPPEML